MSRLVQRGQCLAIDVEDSLRDCVVIAIAPALMGDRFPCLRGPQTLRAAALMRR